MRYNITDLFFFILGVSKNSAVKPEGVDAGGDVHGASAVMAKLVLRCRPRYHFAGLHGIHYERQPYRNHRVLNEQTKHVTRFIGLGKVGNPHKRKWLYAFNIVPMKTVDRKELVAQPKDATDSPFDEQMLGVSQQWRFQLLDL